MEHETLRAVLMSQAASASFVGRITSGPHMLYAPRFLGRRATTIVADIVRKEPWRLASGQTGAKEERE